MEIAGSLSKPLIKSYAPFGNSSINKTKQKLLSIYICSVLNITWKDHHSAFIYQNSVFPSFISLKELHITLIGTFFSGFSVSHLKLFLRTAWMLKFSRQKHARS